MKIKKPFALWLVGPTSSGKTTIATSIYNSLISRNIPVLHYDGDEIRNMFGASLSFSKEDRLKVVKTLVYLANKTTLSRVNVIVSALTAFEDAREYVMNNVTNLIIGYIQCNISVCIERDTKGLYKKAINGEIDTLPGINSIYAPPQKYDLIVDSEHNTVQQSVDIILHNMKTKGFEVE